MKLHDPESIARAGERLLDLSISAITMARQTIDACEAAGGMSTEQTYACGAARDALARLLVVRDFAAGIVAARNSAWDKLGDSMRRSADVTGDKGAK